MGAGRGEGAEECPSWFYLSEVLLVVAILVRAFISSLRQLPTASVQAQTVSCLLYSFCALCWCGVEESGMQKRVSDGVQLWELDRKREGASHKNAIHVPASESSNNPGGKGPPDGKVVPGALNSSKKGCKQHSKGDRRSVGT